jgi:predicted metal-dependent phosphoesterase TrpH
MGKIIADMHMHSTASDGTDTPVLLAEKVRDAGISVFSLTDHDTIAGIREIMSVIPEGIRFVPGIEFSCISDAGKCHILGYNCDCDHQYFREALRAGEKLRRAKLDRRLDYLMEVCGVEITAEERDSFYRMNSVGKPHLAKFLIRKGKAETMQEAIDRFIKPSGTEDSRLPSEMVIRAILESGGIPVWAHPLGGEGERRLGREEFLREKEALVHMGLRGLECFYSRFTQEEIRGLLEEASAAELLVSGGSDYHGKNKNIAPGTLNAEMIPVDAEQLTLLRELGIK